MNWLQIILVVIIVSAVAAWGITASMMRKPINPESYYDEWEAKDEEKKIN
jgi:hypothetical protein